MSEVALRPGDRLGFVGLGRMGVPMARRLAEAGFQVTGYDSTPGGADVLTGVPGFRLADTLHDVATDAAAVLLMLPNSDVVEQVLEGDGLADCLPAGTLIIDMGSSDPIRERRLAERVRSKGVVLVDAPVSGGVSGALAGTLTIMVGGSSEAVGRAGEVFGCLGQRVFHCGEVGAGDAVKALNNLMSATHLLNTSEALITARAFGLDPSTVLAVVNASSGRSGSTENKWPNFILEGTFDSGFALRLMLKDMKTAVDLAQAVNGSSRLSQESVALWARAADELPADADHTEIARWLMASAPNQEADA